MRDCAYYKRFREECLNFMTPNQCKYDLTGQCLHLGTERLEAGLRERDGEASARPLRRLVNERDLTSIFDRPTVSRGD